MYEHAQSAYMRYAQTEADAAAFVKVDFEDLRDQASLVGVARNRMMHVLIDRDAMNTTMYVDLRW